MAYPILCAECTVATFDFERGWRVYLASDEPPEAVTYCPRLRRARIR